MILAAAVLLAAGPAPAPAHAPTKNALAGLYQIQTMEVGGGLELRKNGHFRYALEYGALDEEAQGTWTVKNGNVLLTTRPAPKQPTFDLLSDDAAPKCTLHLTIDWSKLDWSSAPDALVTYERDPKELHFLQSDDNGDLHPEDCAVTMIMPLVPMYHVPGAPIKLSPATGHRIALRFEPNELGHAAFTDEPLKITASGLLMERYDAEIRFVRVRP
jgi:hypothetical protein